MSWVEAIFVLLSLVALGSALLVVTTSHLVHAALWLVVTLGVGGRDLPAARGGVRGLGAGADLRRRGRGAAAVRADADPGADRPPGRPRPYGAPLPAALVAGLVGVLLAVTVVAGFRDVRLDLDQAVVGSAETTGTAIFTFWVLPFEVLSVLLLAALVGAIVLSRLRADLSGADVAGRRHRLTARRGGTADAAVVAVAGGQPALRDRRVRGAGASQRGAGADGRRADAQRGEHQLRRVRRPAPRRAARRPDVRAVHDRDRGRRGRPGPGDRAAGVPHPRPHRGRRAAGAGGPGRGSATEAGVERERGAAHGAGWCRS